MCNGYGSDCKTCGGSGVFVLTSCPWKSIDRATVDTMKMIRAAERHLPLSGGLLDQTQSFVDAQDWIQAERNRWEAESMK